MNTHMYQHPLTADHLKVAQDRLGYRILGPQGAGKLACGDEGESPRDLLLSTENAADTRSWENDGLEGDCIYCSRLRIEETIRR